MAKLIGDVIRNHRRALDLTQEELAARSAVDISFISRVERGITVPSVPLLIQLAQALNTSATKLTAEVERQLGAEHGSRVAPTHSRAKSSRGK